MQKNNSKRVYFALVILAGLFVGFIPSSSVIASVAALVPSTYFFTFNADGVMQEAGSMEESQSGYWWLNSGGKLLINDGSGSTIHGALPANDPWRTLYNAANPSDTDNGSHPQNLFRLVSRNQWENVHVESMFKIDKDNFSTSPNRNASNGLLMMLRYRDSGQTLYYVGVRVDGYAIIKKKYKGTYYTMAQKKIFDGTYVTGGTSNLLPHGAWLSLAGETVTNANGSVSIRLLMKKPGESTFTKILESTDASGGSFGPTPITGKGYVGIRTDFMDVSFDTFKAVKI